MLDEDRQLACRVLGRYALTLVTQSAEQEFHPCAFIQRALNASELTSPAEAFSAGQGEGGAVQGLLTALCVVIRTTPRDRHYYHYWYSEVLRKEMQAWCDPADCEGLRLLAQDAISMGINLRGREPALFLSGLHSILGADSAWSHARLKGDALTTAFAIKSSSLAYAGADLELALKVAAQAPICAELAAVLLGEMTGAYYGLAELCKRDTPHYMEVAAAAREANDT